MIQYSIVVCTSICHPTISTHMNQCRYCQLLLPRSERFRQSNSSMICQLNCQEVTTLQLLICSLCGINIHKLQIRYFFLWIQESVLVNQCPIIAPTTVVEIRTTSMVNYSTPTHNTAADTWSLKGTPRRPISGIVMITCAVQGNGRSVD